MENLRQNLMIAFIVICAVMDLKNRKIHTMVFVIFGFLGITIGILEFHVEDLMVWCISRCGVFAGMILILVSRMTEGAIGEGDGLFFVVTGFFTGPFENVLLLCYGSLICGITALIIYVIGLFNKKNWGRVKLPFIPFVLLAELGGLFL